MLFTFVWRSQTTRSSDNGRAKLKLNFVLGDHIALGIVGFGGLACSAGGWWMCAVGRPTQKVLCVRSFMHLLVTAK
jgi:hypothetical protein